MLIRVRLNGPLPSHFGRAHLTVPMDETATVADLLTRLSDRHPDAKEALETAVPVIGGAVVPRQTPLEDGQEVALLVPISGG